MRSSLKVFVLLLLLPFFSLAQTRGIIPYRQGGIASLYENYFTLEEADSLLKTDPKNPDYYDLRGEIYFQLNRMDEAHRDYSKSIALNSTEPTYYQHRAILLWSLKMPDEAIADCNQALLYAGKDDTLKHHTLGVRGNAKAMKRDYQGAYEDYMTIFKLDSTDVGALTGLGAVLDDLGKEDDAIAYLERALKLSPNDVGVNGNLGYRHMMKGNYQKALGYYNKALELDPESGLSYNNRGFIYNKLNHYDQALTDVNKSLVLFPENAFAYKNRALIYIDLKQEDKACADIQKALQYGFTEMYGDEVELLKKKHCLKNL
jgi:Flp pilus assembly protein TadD